MFISNTSDEISVNIALILLQCRKVFQISTYFTFSGFVLLRFLLSPLGVSSVFQPYVTSRDVRQCGSAEFLLKTRRQESNANSICRCAVILFSLVVFITCFLCSFGSTGMSGSEPVRWGRKRVLPSCPNPLFLKWLTELRDEAKEKGLKIQYTYQKVWAEQLDI